MYHTFSRHTVNTTVKLLQVSVTTPVKFRKLYLQSTRTMSRRSFIRAPLKVVITMCITVAPLVLSSKPLAPDCSSRNNAGCVSSNGMLPDKSQYSVRSSDTFCFKSRCPSFDFVMFETCTNRDPKTHEVDSCQLDIENANDTFFQLGIDTDQDNITISLNGHNWNIPFRIRLCANRGIIFSVGFSIYDLENATAGSVCSEKKDSSPDTTTHKSIQITETNEESNPTHPNATEMPATSHTPVTTTKKPEADATVFKPLKLLWLLLGVLLLGVLLLACVLLLLRMRTSRKRNQVAITAQSREDDQETLHNNLRKHVSVNSLYESVDAAKHKPVSRHVSVNSLYESVDAANHKPVTMHVSVNTLYESVDATKHKPVSRHVSINSLYCGLDMNPADKMTRHESINSLYDWTGFNGTSQGADDRAGRSTNSATVDTSIELMSNNL